VRVVLGFELAQLPADLEAGDPAEVGASGLDRAEGVGLTPAAVLRQGQEGVKPFPQWVLVDGRLQQADGCGRVAPAQALLGCALQGIGPDAAEPGRGLDGHRLAVELGQRITPPQRQRLVEATGGDEILEPEGVDLAAVHGQAVAGRLGEEHGRLVAGQASGLEGAAEVGDVGPQRRVGLRRFVAPEQQQEPLGRHDAAGFEQQHAQDGPLLGRAQVHGPASIVESLDPAEHPQLHPGSGLYETPPPGSDGVLRAADIVRS
jgi:hypothetical protein